MVALERDILVTGGRVYPVRQWRDGLDKNALPREHWWLNHVLLPLLRFSRKYFRIPAPARMTVHPDGRVTFDFFEDEGIYTDEAVAVSLCENEYWMVKRTRLNERKPPCSCDLNESEYPLSDQPRRFVDAPLAVQVIPTAHIAELKYQVEKLTKAVSR